MASAAGWAYLTVGTVCLVSGWGAGARGCVQAPHSSVCPDICASLGLVARLVEMGGWASPKSLLLLPVPGSNFDLNLRPSLSPLCELAMRTSALLMTWGLESIFSDSFIQQLAASPAHVPGTGESVQNKTDKSLGVGWGRVGGQIKRVIKELKIAARGTKTEIRSTAQSITGVGRT